MRRYAWLALGAVLLLSTAAASARSEWRLSVHRGDSVHEHALAGIDSIGFHASAEPPSGERLTVYEASGATEYVVAEIDSLGVREQAALPTGACCDGSTGACTLTTEPDCAYHWLGEGTVCSPGNCTAMVLLPAGDFVIGSPEDEPGRLPEESQHRVYFTREILVSKYETTQAEWQAVMDWNESYYLGPSHPVERVAWFDAISYCNRRSLLEGYTPAYTLQNVVYSGNHIASATVTWNQESDGFRLLTESEWEYACRAGSTTAFCNGDITRVDCLPVDPNLTLVAWYCGNCYATHGFTHDVGLRSPNAWGLYDMHGLNYEWTWDWYGPYDGTFREVDPTGPPTGERRVVRGGWWGGYAWTCRSAMRGSLPVSGFYTYDTATGLRIARTVFAGDAR